MVLPIALGMLAVLTVSVVVVLDQSTASSRHAARSKGDQNAFVLAEAGINNVMAVLANPSNNALKQHTLVSCAGAESTWNRSDYAGGYVLWCGTLNAASALWDVTAIGKVRNPAGTQMISRKLTARVVVTPTYTQPLNNPAWNYIYSRRTGNTCDQYVSNNVGGGSRFYVAGNLCLNNNVGITASTLIVAGDLDLANNAFVGASTSMSTRVETYVGGNCKYGATGSWGACGGDQDARHIWSKMTPPTYVVGVENTAPVVAAPTADFPTWYTNAIPGPTSACTTASGTPPVFDNDTTRNNSVSTIFDLTPATSYTCRVGPSDNPSGELSWNHTTKVLTVAGTMYIDGSAKVGNLSLNQYNGQATIYLSGTFLLNGSLCGGITGGACDFNAWNPNTEMLTIVADGSGGQAGTGNSILVDNNSSFQGGLFATEAVSFDNNSKSDGPIVGSHVVMANNMTSDSFPTITVVPVGMPGNPAVYAQPNPPQMFSG